VGLVHRFFHAGAYYLTTLNGFNGLLSDYKSEKKKHGVPGESGREPGYHGSDVTKRE